MIELTPSIVAMIGVVQSALIIAITLFVFHEERTLRK